MSIEEVGGSTDHELITQSLGLDGLRIKDGNNAIAAVLRSITAELNLAQQLDLIKEDDRLGIVISGTNGVPLFSLYQYGPVDFEANFEADSAYYALIGGDDGEEVYNVLRAFYTFANIAAEDLSSGLLYGMVRTMALAANYNGNLPKEQWPEEFRHLLIDAE